MTKPTKLKMVKTPATPEVLQLLKNAGANARRNGAKAAAVITITRDGSASFYWCGSEELSLLGATRLVEEDITRSLMQALVANEDN